MGRALGLQVAEPRFTHEALMYAGLTDFLAQTVPFVAAAVNASEPVLVALPQVRVSALQQALGARAEAVQFLHMEQIGRNPGRIISEWHRFVDRRPDDGRPVHGIGEPIWAERSPDELAECHLHESLLNEAFEHTSGFTLVCPYDTAGLDAQAIEKARRTHPVLRREGSSSASADYSPGAVREQHFRETFGPPPTDAQVVLISGRGPQPGFAALRRLIAEHANSCGLPEPRVRDLVLAVHEMIVNALQHDEQASLRLWREDDVAACEVQNAAALQDPMVGRRYPGHAALSGRGLWLVNQLADLVQIRSTENGTSIRVRVAASR